MQAQFDSLPDSAPPDNPLMQPPGYSWSYSNATENYFVDNSDANDTNGLGEPGPYQVTTSAGEAFQQLPTRDTGYLNITMTRNEASHDAAADDVYSNKVDQNGVQLDASTYAPGTLKLSPISATKNNKTLKTGQVVVYYAKTYNFSARHQCWSDYVNDAGFCYSAGVKTDGTQTLLRILDGSALAVTQPWPLDGKGNAKPNATDTPAVLVFKKYTKQDWSPFNFQ